jgi:hypothetical protein
MSAVLLKFTWKYRASPFLPLPKVLNQSSTRASLARKLTVCRVPIFLYWLKIIKILQSQSVAMTAKPKQQIPVLLTILLPMKSEVS